jgi:hypothetical protein
MPGIHKPFLPLKILHFLRYFNQHGLKNHFIGKFLFYKKIILSTASNHCNENPIYVFLFWELRGLGPNFHIHVSVSIFPGSATYILQQNRQIHRSQTHERGNWPCGPKIPFFGIFMFEISASVLCSVHLEKFYRD